MARSHRRRHGKTWDSEEDDTPQQESGGSYGTFYHLEPILNFSHVLKAYTDVDHFVEVRLLKNNSPMDCSNAGSIVLTAGKTVMDESSIDTSDLSEGILRINFRGLPTGAYTVPIVVTIDGQTIVFGHIRVFVSDTRRSDDITTFYYYPDTDEEEEEWNVVYGDGDDDDGDVEDDGDDGGDWDAGDSSDMDEGGDGEDPNHE